MSTRIWHNQFVHDWMRAFPLGNGRIGAMVYGNPHKETLEINEESLWSGKQHPETYHSSPEALSRLRQLLFAEKYQEAAALCAETFLAKPCRVRFYESFGELTISYSDKQDYREYRKELELSEAIARVSYRKGDTQYSSEMFVSERYDCLVYRMCTEGSPFSCEVTMERAQDAFTSVLNDSTLLLNGQIIFQEDPDHGEGVEGMQFGARIHAVSDGRLSSAKHTLMVEGAHSLTLYCAFATNYDVNRFDIDPQMDYRGALRSTLAALEGLSYEEIRQTHIADHKQWFDTLSFSLDGPDYEDLPTDERLRRVINGQTDDQDLYALYYQFGRYLLIESSGKKATLPANLQGIWCSGFTPPWGSDYHTNINLQMNYWPAESANLSNTFAPLVHFMKMLSSFGTHTAKALFDAEGWVINHTTDIFGRTGVHDSVHCGFFPMAGPWMCLNLWEHYEYSNDRKYLEDIYPILKGSCRFVMDYLVEDSQGYLITNPSNSPENRFYYYDEQGQKQYSMFTYGATMDFQILHALLTRTITACSLLDRDEDFAASLEQILSKLPPLRISERYGTICEWIKDYEEQEPGHRHISHLFGLFPGDQINETDPAIYQAAKNTIARRLSHGGGATGWSRAWIINFYARLKDRENAMEHLRQLMVRSTAENLFDMHPPFQIDGNFGAVSGITEMLLQSHLGTPENRIIELLPALPEQWANGFIKGIKARGNFSFDLDWSCGTLRCVSVTALCDHTLRLKWPYGTENFTASKSYTVSDSVLTMTLSEGETVRLQIL